MSLESSQERPEQEQPRSDISAETDYIPAVQGDNGRGPLPANVPPTQAAPDPNELVVLLLSWIRTPDWSASQTYLQTHPELLTDGAVQVLAALAQHHPDRQVRQLLTQHQLLLQIAHRQGVERAYEFLLQRGDEAGSASNDLEELANQLIAWLQTPDWETSQTYLRRHPLLLTDAAEQMMEVFKRSQGGQQAQAMISLHQALLQKARVEGIKAAYKRFLVPEPETALSDQEGATYHALQDPTSLNDAAMAALQQYWASGQVVNLNQAVEYWYAALKLIPSDSPDRPTLLSNLGTGLSNRYGCTGDLTDLEAAITAFQQAVQASPSNSPDWPGG